MYSPARRMQMRRSLRDPVHSPRLSPVPAVEASRVRGLPVGLHRHSRSSVFHRHTSRPMCRRVRLRPMASSLGRCWDVARGGVQPASGTLFSPYLTTVPCINSCDASSLLLHYPTTLICSCLIDIRTHFHIPYHHTTSHLVPVLVLYAASNINTINICIPTTPLLYTIHPYPSCIHCSESIVFSKLSVCLCVDF
jgi:hypothetical protein